MISFGPLWELAKEKGISTYTLKNKWRVGGRTLEKLKKNDNVTTNTLNKLCQMLQCRLSDIAEYVEDTEDAK